MAQGKDPEFKPQYCKKKKINKIKNQKQKTWGKSHRNLYSSSGPQGQVLPRILEFPFAQLPTVTSDLPGIPVIRASVILICRLECELTLREAFKDSLSSHLNFQLHKRMGEKMSQNTMSNPELVEKRKSVQELTNS
jgi:hypothetical protein